MPLGRNEDNEADQRQRDSCGNEPMISVASADFSNLANDKKAADRPTNQRETGTNHLECGSIVPGV